ncbi:hypothetical protein DdX_14473 [Ditylenchus destructor]|uniref:Uncharacterized protein n=1 Tax=Ditylenchus destructor TaxID=166010 RepID=A0AAD4MR32_9BILA|nr:hypothetical protein DdX_14473 [Ditylenchus destructor]
MGAGYSAVSEPALRRFVCVTLESPEQLQLMDSENENGIAYKFIKKEWSSRVERISKRGFVWVFRLNGRPFVAPLITLTKSHVVASVEVRDFMCRFIGRLEHLGLCLEGSVYSGKLFTRTTLMFSRPTEDFKIPFEAQLSRYDEHVICIAIRGRNVLQFPLPAQLASQQMDEEEPAPRLPVLFWIRNEFRSQIDNETVTAQYVEVAFKGTPFSTSKFEEMITAKRLFLGLIRYYYAMDYQLCASMSLKGNAKNDTFFFRKVYSPQKPLPKNFFLMSMENKNCLRLYECPVEAVRHIESCFGSGHVKQVKPSYMGCLEIILANNPFYTHSNQLVESQLQLLEIFNKLWENGWKCSGSIQISQAVNDKATVVFETAEKEEEEVKPQKPVANQKRSLTKLHSASPQACHHLFGLATARLDLIRILNPQPPNLKTLLREMIINQWDKGIQEEVPLQGGHCFKLRGRPWASRDLGPEANAGLHLLVFICEQFERLGWKLLCSLDCGSKINDDDEFHLYCEDGELLLFHYAPSSVPTAYSSLSDELFKNNTAINHKFTALALASALPPVRIPVKGAENCEDGAKVEVSLEGEENEPAKEENKSLS